MQKSDVFYVYLELFLDTQDGRIEMVSTNAPLPAARKLLYAMGLTHLVISEEDFERINFTRGGRTFVGMASGGDNGDTLRHFSLAHHNRLFKIYEIVD